MIFRKKSGIKSDNLKAKKAQILSNLSYKNPILNVKKVKQKSAIFCLPCKGRWHGAAVTEGLKKRENRCF